MCDTKFNRNPSSGLGDETWQVCPPRFSFVLLNGRRVSKDEVGSSAFLFRTREVPGSNIGPETCCLQQMVFVIFITVHHSQIFLPSVAT